MPGSPLWRRRATLAAVAGVTTLGTVLLASGAAFGAAKTVPPDTSTVAGLGVATNILWVTIGAALVIFMQAGFALVETGFCRAKHAAHVVSTNFAIFGLGFVAFFIVGYRAHVRWLLDVRCSAIAARGRQPHRLRQLGVPLEGPPLPGGSGEPYSAGVTGLLPLHGRLHGHHRHDSDRRHGRALEVERLRRLGPLLRRDLLPAVRRVDLGRRWLASLGKSMHAGFGYVDFAGSGVVHAMGGIAALAGAIVLGPRIGKYGKDGKPRALPAHHIPMAMLGTFILLFGWFGFNAASTLAATDIRFAVIATNTATAAAFGAIDLPWSG